MSTVQRTAAVVTISDSCAQGTKEDTSGKLLQQKVADMAHVVSYEILPDDVDVIQQALVRLVDQVRVDYVFTTGGTGIGPRDVTPEATHLVIEKQIPGISELMRMQTAGSSPTSVLSRAVCGVRGKTIIVNLPGSPRGVEECLAVIISVLPHANDMIYQRPHEHH